LEFRRGDRQLGVPGIRVLSGRARRVRLDGYISRIIDRDFADELGQQVRRPDTLRRRDDGPMPPPRRP
jgi:hypothetical protein